MNNDENFKKSEQSKKLIKIYNHFGQETQMKKLIEEANELAEAVKSGNTDHIAEEIADLMVLIEQIMIAFPILSNRVNSEFSYKIERTLDRIESGYYESEVK